MHAEHGVARYEGMPRMEADGKESDWLLLEYAQGQRLCVPMERIDLVQKYTGGMPRLDRLKFKQQRHPTTYWLEALPDAYEWPGLGMFPDIAKEESGNAAGSAEWRSASHAYKLALHADPKYRQATIEFLEGQRREPQALLVHWWAFRDKVLGVESTEPEGVSDRET